MTPKVSIDGVNSANSLAEFIDELKQSLIDDPQEWENGNLVEFLDALSSWIYDIDGYYFNLNLPLPETPTWKTFAEMLIGAKYYE